MRFFAFFFLLFFAIVGLISGSITAYAETPSVVLPKTAPNTAPTAKDVIKGIADQVKKVIKRQEASKAQKTEKELLDALFVELKFQSKTGPAGRTSKRIWRKWGESGSDSINLLMERANTALNLGRKGLALDLLDQVTTLAPNYAEGWNRRATVFFLSNEFGRSIADIERTLALEPRHFGALAGLAGILSRLGRDNEALETWFKVLKIYPANEIAQRQVILLTEKMYGERT